MSEARSGAQPMLELDGVRAIAIGVVMALHGSYGTLRGGFLGVDLFFVLSGFLITLLLKREQEAFGRISFWRFYARRALRILPPLIAGLMLAAVLGGFSFASGGQPILLFYANFVDHLRLGTMIHMWSLAVEEQFYLVWPVAFGVAVWAGGIRLAALVALAVLLGSMAFRISIFLDGMDPELIYRHTLARSDSLAAGALIALLPLDWARRLPRLLPGLLALVIVVLSCVALRTHWAMISVGHTGFALICAVFLASLVAAPSQSRAKALISHPMLRWVGRHSYGIYIYHIPIFVALEAFREKGNMLNLAGVTSARVGLSFFVAWLSFRLLEQPILSLKRHFYPDGAMAPSRGPVAPAIADVGASARAAAG